ncbi:hypothetical protein ACPZ19_16575 [Amycolatopsis lurida]
MAGGGSYLFSEDGVPVIPGDEFTRELAQKTDKRLLAMYQKDREVMRRRVRVPPREKAAVEKAQWRVGELTRQRWEVEERARTRADAEWVAANPLVLPRLPWWPGWRRRSEAEAQERRRWEYRDDPDRRRFVAEAVQAEAQRFYADYRQEHGADFLELLERAYAENRVAREPETKREHLRTAARLRSQVVVRVLYERHDNDVRWVAGFLGTTQAKIRECLGIPHPRPQADRHPGNRHRHGGGGDGGYFGGFGGGGCGGGGCGGGGGGGE